MTPIELLTDFVASLPDAHPERPGVLRAIEVLRHYGEETAIDSEFAARMSEIYSRTVRRVAADLRRAAEDIERRAVPGTHLKDLLPDHMRSAKDVVHEIEALIGNLSLERVMESAAEADEVARGWERHSKDS